MNDLEFSFESAAWEEYIDNLNGSASAVTLLTMTEAEDEQALEDALQLLEDREIPLDISDLPKPMISGEAALRLRGNLPIPWNSGSLHTLPGGFVRASPDIC